jgi:alpha-mannosidase
MNEMIAQLGRLKARAKGYWAERVTAELEYAMRLSRMEGRRHDTLLRSVIASLESEADEAGAVTREIVEETEGKLGSLGAEAKGYTLMCAAHAHIDMNWLWRYDETVSLTLDTFRTMLDLMNEYPSFTFSQSQASVYRIVEEHDPELLKEIRRRVKEDRWEVTASTWVETDKNMPCGESLARHVLYTKRYLARLFDLAPERLAIDFEPDTFGHSRNVPEILTRGGVRHYYHCRGYDGHNLYRWQAPSGAEVLVYRDPFWYNAEISPAMAAAVPEFCNRHGMDTMLRPYGVGDHGGGPTRRDIERIIDMDTWPVFPRVRFGTFAGYFALAEKVRERLPVVNKELNVVFTGCYTTQTRIKAANRTAEVRLAEAEAFSGVAALAAGGQYRADVFGSAWEKVLFNQFHDILAGSGIVDTREYALGLFQQAMASATTEQTLALRRIAAQVDTADLADPRAALAAAPWDESRASTSEGAGVGWGIDSFQVGAVDRGRGRTRIFHVFNALAHARSGIAELVVWDWEGDPKRLVVKDAAGTVIAHQVLPAEPLGFFKAGEYWGHNYLRVIVPVQVPGLGTTTCTLSEAVPSELDLPMPTDPRVERPDAFVLENERLRAEFDTETCALRSLVDRSSGEELLGRPGAGFRRVDEDDAKGMTAWTVGRWMRVRSLREGVRVAARGIVKGPVRQSLSYEIAFDSSKLTAVVSLDAASPVLRWSVECEWLEVGRKGVSVPQLNFHLPLAFECKSYRYDMPFGTVDRAPVAQDMPASSWAAAVSKKAGRRTVMLVAGQNHGFRCVDDSLSLTLIRSSYDPDPFPELGVHRFDFGISLGEGGSSAGLIRAAAEYNHGFSVVSAAPHPGTLPKAHGFVELETGSVVLAAMKMAEDGGRHLVLRLHEADGKEATAVLRFFEAPAAAWLADLNEHRLEAGASVRIDGPVVSVAVAPYSVVTLVVEFPGAAA